MTVVRPYFNETRGSRFFETRPGDRLEASAFTFETSTTDPERAGEEAFMFFNRDDRPNGRTERSVSVADVLCIMNDDGMSWWSVDKYRLTRLSDDVVASFDRDADPDAEALARQIAEKLTSDPRTKFVAPFPTLREMASGGCLDRPAPAQHEAGIEIRCATLSGKRAVFRVTVERIA